MTKEEITKITKKELKFLMLEWIVWGAISMCMVGLVIQLIIEIIERL